MNLGYYAHLITDAEFQRYIRDDKRVEAAWDRFENHAELRSKADGMPKNRDSVKLLINNTEQRKDIYAIESEYPENHPGSGYLTEIPGLKTFPDYIDYLPKGAIVRKINIMGYMPRKEPGKYPYIGMSKEEYTAFPDQSTRLVLEAFSSKDAFL